MMQKQVSMAHSFDVEQIRKDFPVLQQSGYGKRLAFLDSAASSQKPQSVINAITECYSSYYANIHRGVYQLSMESTKRFEAARKKVQHFLGAKSSKEIIFVRGGTEALNLIAHSYGELLQPGDSILVSEMEHHANIVPWQMLRDRKQITLKVIPFLESGELDMQAYEALLESTPRVKLVAVTHVSNALGTINPVRKMAEMAHDAGAVIVVDGCQAVPHLPVNVQDLDADFYVFSGHKAYGPSGIGALYGKEALLEQMPPYQTGGEMIRLVTFEKTEFHHLPHKFEAGTPAIAEAIGLGAAIDYLSAIGMEAVQEHGADLLRKATKALEAVEGLRIYGTAPYKVGLVAFTLDQIHPHDAGTIFDHEGVAVRAGHHCAHPVMQHYGIPATIRASFGIYSNDEDIAQLVAAIKKTQEMFR